MGAEYISVINNAGGNTAKGTFSVNTHVYKTEREAREKHKEATVRNLQNKVAW